MSAPSIDSTEGHDNLAVALSGSARDVSGSSIFSIGDVGEAHVMAHRLFDEGRSQLGRMWLGRWLTRHMGCGSDWIHLEFHMALFELETGSWDAAYARFLQKILPAAATSELALQEVTAPGQRTRMAAS